MNLSKYCSKLLLTMFLGEFNVSVRGGFELKVPAQGLFIEVAEIVSCYRSLFRVSDTARTPSYLGPLTRLLPDIP